MDKSRRQLLRGIGGMLACYPFIRSLAGDNGMGRAALSDPGNFQYIYNNSDYKEEFYKFLTNVFHLYPEKELHQLIKGYLKKHSSDQDVYTQVQKDLSLIKPMLADLTYAIPALNKQKHVMAEQTLSLLNSERGYEGYLEIGSTGRYLDSLEEVLNINGERHFISEEPATYAIENMIDRGQVIKAGETISLNNYQPKIEKNISSGSIELATIYIGFHHCPISLRESFITSIRDAMKPGASLIVRDHDARNEKMQKMVALAHDVFNMGTKQSWAYNEQELRRFYSLQTLDDMLTRYGFKSDGRRMFQKGDPTLNALMIYKKA